MSKIGLKKGSVRLTRSDYLPIGRKKMVPVSSAVLGVDAAWTLTQPSGVALVAKIGSAWQLVWVSPSYEHFHAHANGDLSFAECRPSGSRPDAAALLESASKLCARKVDLVAIDIPLARGPITGRRVSDDEVSRDYGARKCGTHSPNCTRPGVISDELKVGFEHKGYLLQTKSESQTNTISRPGLIEVYPHPALVELTNAPERLRYKVSKVRSYYPDLSTSDRKTRLFQEWDRIIRHLEVNVSGIAEALPLPPLSSKWWMLKSYEDKLDAVICAWVAVCALEGHVKPFGDKNSAIWIPNCCT